MSEFTPEITQLKRSISLPLLTFYGLGTILGAGIYVLTGEVAREAGMAAPVAFAVAALIAGFAAFTFAEVSSRLPQSAGEAAYTQEAFGRPWLSALVGWSVVLIGLVSAATITNGFVGYLHLFIKMPPWLVITLLVLLLGGLAAWGITESVMAASVITLIEVGGLLLVVVLAGEHLAELPQRLPEMLPSSAIAWSGTLLGAFVAFYAFIGFEDMVNIAEEVKEPERNLPRGIILALLISTLLYLLVALVAVLALPLAKLSQSNAPMADIVISKGYSPTWIGLISMLAVINGALVQMVMASRVVYGLSRQGQGLSWFSYVNPVTRTPVRATLLITGITLTLALWLPLSTLAKITSFITLCVFSMVSLSLIRLKHRDPTPENVRTFPIWVPYGCLVLSLALLGFQMMSLWFFGD